MGSSNRPKRKILSLNHDGLLSYMGYSVGHSGQLMSARHTTLDRVMQSRLPMIISEGYMLEWSDPNSQARLRKLTDCLAGFRELHFKKVNTTNSEAIRDWTNDLRYLKEKYFDGSWNWRWPC